MSNWNRSESWISRLKFRNLNKALLAREKVKVNAKKPRKYICLQT